LLIDGIHFGGEVLFVILNIDESAIMQALELWQRATENIAVVKGLLEYLMERGLDAKRHFLVVIDGSKALRRVWGVSSAVVPTCCAVSFTSSRT
jgi:hypothetical protein